MSSLLLCADVAPERPVVFARREKPALVFARLSALPKLAGVTQASRLEVRPTPEIVSSGIRELDALTGGLPRGCLTEICGPASSGRTSVLLATLVAATRRQEVCALVDASDAFDPLSAAAAGVDFEKMLWVRCTSHEEKSPPQRHRDTEQKRKKQLQPGNNREGPDFSRADKRSLKIGAAESVSQIGVTGKDGTNFILPAAERRENKAHGVSRGKKVELARAPKGRQNSCYTTPEDTGPLEQALRATDLLLQSGGFGLIVLDLGDVPFQTARRIPLTTWFRFQRAVETTPTVLFVIAETPLAQTCAALLLKVQASGKKLSAFSSQLSVKDIPAHAQLLEGLHVEGELLRSRLERKPVQSVNTAFTTHALQVSS